MAHAWVAGEELDEILADEEFSGGDFVRNMKQLLDLLRQIGEAAPEPRHGADGAEPRASALFRGVVSASSAVRSDDDGEALGNEGEGVDDDVVDAAP